MFGQSLQVNSEDQEVDEKTQTKSTPSTEQKPTPEQTQTGNKSSKVSKTPSKDKGKPVGTA